MELFDSIKTRISVRAFRPDSVPKEIISNILRLSVRSPSGVNSQPWEFYVVRGNALDDLKQANLEAYRQGIKPHPEVPVGAIKGVSPVLEGVYKDRQVELAKQIFRIMGISKEDREGQEAWNESMVRFYDAPAIIILVVDKVLQGAWPILDIGLITQNIVLCAQEFGLGSCIMRAIVDYPELIREIVGIPESKRIIVGIAIGYPDEEHHINRLKTNRENPDKITTWVE